MNDVILDILFLTIAFILLWRCQLLTFLYDAKIDDNGINFILFRCLNLYFLPYSDVDSVEETKGYLLFVFNFKNRLLSRSFLIKKKKGLIIKHILITPANSDKLESTLLKRGVKFTRKESVRRWLLGI